MRSKRIGIINTNPICAEKEQNCPKQKSSATGSRRIAPRSEARQNVSRAAANDESKKRPTASQEMCACAKSQDHDASRSGNNGATVR